MEKARPSQVASALAATGSRGNGTIVVARFRPLNAAGPESKAPPCVRDIEPSSVTYVGETERDFQGLPFTFDRVFGPNSTQVRCPLLSLQRPMCCRRVQLPRSSRSFFLKNFALLLAWSSARSFVHSLPFPKQSDVFEICKETAERALLGFNGASNHTRDSNAQTTNLLAGVHSSAACLKPLESACGFAGSLRRRR